MTAKEAKAYLMQYRESMARAHEITEHLGELKAEAVRLRDHEGQRVELDAAVARYVDACDESARELDRLAALRAEIVGTVDAVPERRLRQLLREIYINGKRIVQIAADRDQSYEHICRLHGQALLELSAVMPKNEKV